MVTAVLDWMSYADMAAYTTAFAVTAVTLAALWLLGRCTLRTCACWALCLLPLMAVACEDPDPCDPTCPATSCGETGTCNGE